MRVADLYISLALIGVCVAVGWSAREYHDRQRQRVEALERRMNALTKAALTGTPAEDLLSQVMSREFVGAVT